MFLYNQRGHQVLRVVVADAMTGEVATLIDETSDTFIDYAGKQFLQFVDDNHEIIWMSELSRANFFTAQTSANHRGKRVITSQPARCSSAAPTINASRTAWLRCVGEQGDSGRRAHKSPNPEPPHQAATPFAVDRRIQVSGEQLRHQIS
jgi:hypothetical protein